MTTSQVQAEYSIESIHGIDANQQACLLQIFRIATDSIKLAKAMQATFFLDKFDLAKTKNCEDFELTVRQFKDGDRMLWRGKFESGLDKWLVLTSEASNG